MKLVIMSVLSAFFLGTASAQTDTSFAVTDTLPRNFYLLHTKERNGESLPEIDLKEVVIIGRQSTSKKFPFRRYERLIYNLKRIYPYGIVVRARLEQVNHELMNIPDEKERKKYLRQVEKDVFGEYEDDVRNMTITQGRLLIKLIDRETRNTSYELIRYYRGNLSASFWQAIARIFGTNLKAEYDPYGEDAVMEIILQEIEAGRL